MALHSSADGCLGVARASERAREGARQAYSQAVALRVRAVLDDMAAQGVVPSFYTVAERACVARSTLYRRPELKRLVAEAREAALQPTLHAKETGELHVEDAYALRELAAERGELAAERDELAAGRDELAAERDELAAGRDELAALRRENASLRRERATLVGENAALRRENASLVGENAALRRENASLRASLTRTTAECERLKARLSSADEPPAASQARYGVCPWDAAA